MITDYPQKDYRAKKVFVSPSDIKGVKTPREFLLKRQAPKIWKIEFDIGTALHAAVLEPDKFEQEIACLENFKFPVQEYNKDGSIRMTKKANQDFLKNFREENKDKIILSQAHWDMVQNMRKSVLNLKDIDTVLDLKGSYVEKNFFAKVIFNKFGEVREIVSADPESPKRKPNEVLIKTRPDLFHKDRLFGADVKTCGSADPVSFASDAANFEYDIQAAMEIDIVTAVTGMPYQTFVFVVVEKKEPYEAVIYNLFDEDIEAARKAYQRRLNSIREAMNNNKFSGYETYADNEQGVVLLKLPYWANQNRLESKF